ncbi:MAG: bifunctional aspartate kinase/homoserine dehydrogenase I [Sphingobacteriales bacterium]|nr:bifunctional aspartate kinase/homoserine dehydrogenase I [Sphingobacteriales bacterium]
MKVLKFGGSSVANAENIRRVIAIVEEASKSGRVAVVVSALGGVTDLLLGASKSAAANDNTYLNHISLIRERHLACINELVSKEIQPLCLPVMDKAFQEITDLCKGINLLGETTDRSSDLMVHYGEWLSSQIITMAYLSINEKVRWKDARELIVTNAAFGAAKVDFTVTNYKISHFFASENFPVVFIPGFIASDLHGNTTTLGRGGSDYSAAIIAAALHAEELQIWTDVNGMMTADPRLCSNARIIPKISYQEAMELSHFGAKVIYPPTIQPAMALDIPIWIKNTFEPDALGTIITSYNKLNENIHDHIIRGISSISQIALVTLEGSGMVGIPGFSKRLFEALSQEAINVIMITQSSSEHSITVGIDAGKAEKARLAVDMVFTNEIALKQVAPLKVESNLSIVALVGENMRHHTGVSGRMFTALGRNGINIRAIAQGSSEKNISAVIDTADVRKSINVLHEEFFETTYRQVNVFIAGLGNVGSKLIDQLKKQLSYLQESRLLQIKIIGMANSRKVCFDEAGIDLNKWQQAIENADRAIPEQWVEQLITLNLRNTVFVDVTSSDVVAAVYDKLLPRSISVVACNKIAAASSFHQYQNLKTLSREYHAPFLFETNVGAGLPVISTLNDLIHSGDSIRKIEAVLSGTLNFVFNNYDGSRSFSSVVKQAQEEGYTEPDPRLDLSGTDVMRKILILAREAGLKMELDEVTNRSFMPPSCMEGSVANFYEEMENQEQHFRMLLEEAKAKGCKLKFVASLNEGKASAGLQWIDPAHDLFHLYGKDNIVLFYTDRYSIQPLVIKGAGAGAEVTASGVFADIIRASNL